MPEGFCLWSSYNPLTSHFIKTNAESVVIKQTNTESAADPSEKTDGVRSRL